MINPKTGDKYPVNPNAVWRVTSDTFQQFILKNRVVFPGDYDFLNISKPVLRYFKSDDEAKAGEMFGFTPVSTNLPKEVGMTQDGTKDIGNLFETKIFGFPKPVSLLQYLIKFATSIDKSVTILDFFSGSATTAHAVMQLNAEEGDKHKFIMVQLPEPCDENSDAFKEGYKNIADIGKERIRRAIKQIEDEKKQDSQTTITDESDGNEKQKSDLGFKVFKLDKSNFNIWDGSIKEDTTGDEITKQLQLAIDHIDPDSSEEDILYELLLKSGISLTAKIDEIEIAGKKVYSIDDGDGLLVCLDKELNKEVITGIAKTEPSRVICLDEGFLGNDQLKTNTVQIMKSFGVEDFKTV